MIISSNISHFNRIDAKLNNSLINNKAKKYAGNDLRKLRLLNKYDKNYYIQKQIINIFYINNIDNEKHKLYANAKLLNELVAQKIINHYIAQIFLSNSFLMNFSQIINNSNYFIIINNKLDFSNINIHFSVQDKNVWAIYKHWWWHIVGHLWLAFNETGVQTYLQNHNLDGWKIAYMLVDNGIFFPTKIGILSIFIGLKPMMDMVHEGIVISTDHGKGVYFVANKPIGILSGEIFSL